MIEIDSTADVGKSYSAKREKADDDTEIVNSHLKLSNLFVQRDQIDEICAQPIGWSGNLFDEFGAPVAALTIALDRAEFKVVGGITGPDGIPSLPLLQAKLTGIAFTLTKNGAGLSGELTWSARGDEVEDVTDLLGRTCKAKLNLLTEAQQDLLRNVTIKPLPPREPTDLETYTPLHSSEEIDAAHRERAERLGYPRTPMGDAALPADDDEPQTSTVGEGAPLEDDDRLS